ncbi:MAG: Asp23/Gls24 family envelope stress response protein [Lentisphaeria bacterium]|nr:Asp23/Gls24 family envelope stress response protein [Lentisphaeria bacterium]
MTGKNLKKNTSPKTDYAEAVIDDGSNGPGEIRIAYAALSAIIRRAVCSVDGVSRLAGNSLVDNIAEFVGSKKVMDRAIQITIGDASLEVCIAINIRYGFSLPEIAANVKENVVRQIHDLTGLPASRVDVIIREMEFTDPDDENE